MKNNNRSSKTLGICFVTVALFLSISLNAQSVFDHEGITYRVIQDADEASTFGTVAVTAKSGGFYEGSVVIPNAVKQSDETYADTYKVIAIDAEAFKGCPNLVEVRFPMSLEFIGFAAFSECPKLSKVEIPDGNLYDLGLSAFASSGLESISIPRRVTEIPAFTFNECRQLKQVLLSDNITKIGESAFTYCQSLCLIELPTNLREIGNGAFMACGLKNITLPDQIVSIPENAFGLCFNLEEAFFSPNTKNIGSCAFVFCCHLSKIHCPETASINEDAFYGCIAIPNQYQSPNVYFGIDTKEKMESYIKGLIPQIWNMK